MPNAPPVGRNRFIAPSALSMDCGDWRGRRRNKAIAPYDLEVQIIEAANSIGQYTLFVDRLKAMIAEVEKSK